MWTQETKATKSLLAGESELQEWGRYAEDVEQKRVTTGYQELNLVLGGGLVPGQAIILSGEPGIGKSTLLLQLLVRLNARGVKCIYVSGEESSLQVMLRAHRIYPQREYDGLKSLHTGDLTRVINILESESPEMLVIDSIQTMFDPQVEGLPGSMSQIKAAAVQLVRETKQRGVVLILVGHITKDGDIAGPKVMEHLVDTVLRFEGERDDEYRILRALKNRFGGTGEVGVFVMGESGIEDANFQTGIFAGDAGDVIGAAKTGVLEGNRLFVVQVQALVHDTIFPYPKRVAEGVPISRLQLICAILDRFAKTKLGSKDVYVRTAGGYQLRGPVSDLAIAAAIISSVKGVAVKATDIYLGELSLGGRVVIPRGVGKKLSQLPKHGIKRIWANLDTGAKGLTLERVQSVHELAKK